MRGLAADLASPAGCRWRPTVRSDRCSTCVNLELDQRCLELAVADLRHLPSQHRALALHHLRAIDSALADKLALELLWLSN